VSGFDEVFKRIDAGAHALQARVRGLDRASLRDFEGDVDRMDRAAEKLRELAGDERAILAAAEGAGTLDAPLVSKTRHDLRAQIGAVKGYGELILEELEDLGGDPGAMQQLAELVTAATSLLPIIDALQLERTTEPSPRARPFFSGGDDDVNYAARYLGCVVLHIDDSDDNRRILARRLRGVGLELYGAPSGEEGLRFIADNPVDLILCDVNMPGMSGLDVLRALKDEPRWQEIPVLVISAVSEVDTIVRCIEAGAEDYLNTPFNPTILHARIKACLDKKLLRDADRHHLAELDEARRELESAIESIADGFAIFDSGRRLTRCNRKFRELYPVVSELGDAPALETLLLRNRETETYFVERRLGSQPPDENAADWSRLRVARHDAGEAYMERLRDGRWIEIRNHRIPGGGVVSVHKDVTEYKKDEEHLTFLALHDPLTGLANRSHFEATLADAMQRADRSEEGFALLFIDLDGFKAVNDTLGHHAGDDLLKRVGEALGRSVRDGDLVARLGGDEFAVLLASATDAERVREIGERVVEAVAAEGGRESPIGASVGAALYPRDGQAPEEFLGRADEAMYEAKRTGKGRVCFYGAA